MTSSIATSQLALSNTSIRPLTPQSLDYEHESSGKELFLPKKEDKPYLQDQNTQAYSPTNKEKTINVKIEKMDSAMTPMQADFQNTYTLA